MKKFDVFHHPSLGYEAVKEGFSFPGCFFGPLWAFFNGLVGIGFGLLFLSILLSATVAGGFSIILGFGLMIFVGSQGNKWFVRKLEKKGYISVGKVNASTPENAINKAKTGVGPFKINYDGTISVTVQRFFNSRDDAESFMFEVKEYEGGIVEDEPQAVNVAPDGIIEYSNGTFVVMERTFKKREDAEALLDMYKKTNPAALQSQKPPPVNRDAIYENEDGKFVVDLFKKFREMETAKNFWEKFKEHDENSNSLLDQNNISTIKVEHEDRGSDDNHSNQQQQIGKTEPAKSFRESINALITCEFCAGEIKPEVTFCKHCGIKLRG